MIFFAAYAVAVWFLAAKWRRRWESFAWIAVAALGLLMVAWFHWRLNVWTDGRIYFRVLQAMLYPYSALVIGTGLYIACLPRGVPVEWCQVCRYDLSGLAGEADLCPECGHPHALEPVILAPAAIAPPSAAPGPAAPAWPPIAAPVVCHHQAEQ